MMDALVLISFSKVPYTQSDKKRLNELTEWAYNI